MKTYALVALILASMAAPVFAAEERKVVSVIFVKKDQYGIGFIYNQFDEAGAYRRCYVPDVDSRVPPWTCTEWVDPATLKK